MTGPECPNSSLSRDMTVAAPGLFSELSRAYPRDVTKGLAEVFSAVVESGGSVETTTRTLGANFTPRPARIVKILRHETRESSPEVLAAALIASLPISGRSPAILGHAAAPLACDVWTVLETPSTERSLSADRIVMALLLDDARHFHMQAAETVAIEQYVRRLEREVLPHSRFPENERLVILLQSWCARALPR